MKIQVLSDLHTEVRPYQIQLNPDADVLVLAGDIVTVGKGISSIKNIIDGIDIPIIFVAGNHEYYNTYQTNESMSFVDDYLKNLNNKYPNFHYLNNESLVIDDVKFLGSTLWSDFNLAQDYGFNDSLFASIVTNHISDFFSIKITPSSIFRGHHCMDLCKNSKLWLKEELSKQCDKKIVVVTHFVPHRNAINEQFIGNNLNPYFTTDCDDLLRPPVKLWICGHTHSKFDGIINDTRLVINPRGYPNENTTYDDDFLVDI